MVGSHRSAGGEVTFRALLAALEENGEEARALQLLWEADSAGDANQQSGGYPCGWLRRCLGRPVIRRHVSKTLLLQYS